MAKRKYKFQKIEVVVTGAGAEISKDANTDRLFDNVTGIHVTTTDGIGIQNSLFNKFEINGEEIFCPGFEAKMLNTGQEVSPNDKFYKLNEPALGSTINLKYKDGNAAGVTYPYTVNVILRLENKPKIIINQQQVLNKQIRHGQGSVEND